MWIMQELKDYVKHNGHNVEPIHRFISGSGGTGKPHLVKVIYHPVTKTFLYHCKDPEKKIEFFCLEPQEYQQWNHHSFWSWN